MGGVIHPFTRGMTAKEDDFKYATVLFFTIGKAGNLLKFISNHINNVLKMLLAG